MQQLRLASILLAASLLPACVDEPADAGLTFELGYVPGPGGAPWFTGYQVDGDVAIVQGDMLYPLAEVRALTASIERGVFAGVNRSPETRWPGGIVPFEPLSTALPQATRNEINAAIDHWNASTIVRLVPRAGQPNFLRFVDPGPPNARVCNSFVGRMRFGLAPDGAQIINLGTDCDTAAAIHEIGHALGLHHEQSRRDRDAWVDIREQNVRFADANGDGLNDLLRNFDQYPAAEGVDYGRYDYASIMHYPRGAFAIPGLETVVPLQPTGGVTIGAATQLSTGDRRGIWAAYGPASHTVEMVYNRSGLCADVADGFDGNGGVVKQFACNDASNQRWIVQPVAGGWVEIRGVDSGKCWDLPSGDISNPIQTYDCNGGDNQLWNLFHRGDSLELRPKNRTSCVIANAANRLVVGTCGPYGADTWRLYERPPADAQLAIANAGDGTCFDIPWASHAVHERIQSHACHLQNDRNQRWRFVPAPSASSPKTVRVQSAESALCLEAAGTQVLQRTCNASVWGQRWIMPVMASGAVRLVSAFGMNDGYHGDYDQCVIAGAGGVLTLSTGCDNGAGGNAAEWFLHQRLDQ